MKVWTIQMGQWRKAKERNVTLVDTTVKSGDRLFAPTWDMVTQWHAGALSEAAYTEQYYALMRLSFRNNKAAWLSFLQQDEIALACYCKAGGFCHRHLLLRILEQIALANNIPFQAMGELT